MVKSRYKKITAPSISFAAVFFTGFMMALTQNIPINAVLLYLAEGVMAGSVSFFMTITAELPVKIKNGSGLKTSELVSLLIITGVLLLAFDPFKIYGISPARVLAALFIMFAARYGGENCGAAAGIAFGVILGLSEGSGHLAGGYALAGLLSGLFGAWGRFACALIFIVSNAAVSVAGVRDFSSVYIIAETGIAALMLVALPKFAVKKLSGIFIPGNILPKVDGYKNMLKYRLAAAAETAFDVSQSVKAVTGAISRMTGEDENYIYTRIQNDICGGCVKRSVCWEYRFDSTMRVFYGMTEQVKNGKKTGLETLPSAFAKFCVNAESIADNFNRLFYEYAAKLSAQNKVTEARIVASDQFISLSVMLQNLAGELAGDIILDTDTAALAKTTLERAGLSVTDVICIIGDRGRPAIQAYCARSNIKVNAKKLSAALSETVGIEFDLPVTGDEVGGDAVLMFYEKPPLKITAGTCQHPGEGQAVCGDSFNCFNDGRGHYITILSDGMGTGGRAAVDGSMTCSLSSKLLKAGFDFDCVLKIVNSALLVKSRDESLATLDIASVDLYTGETSFYKAGAAASVISRKGRVVKAEKSSLPLGIIRDVEFGRVSGKVSAGDMLVIMSDGAADCTPAMIKEEILKNKGKPPDRTAGIIAGRAKDEYKSGKQDDITVIVLNVDENI